MPAGLRAAAAGVLLALAGLLLPSCGGGVDSGGTGSAPATLAVGPISGFGSVVVGGVHYDDRDAEVRDGDDHAMRSADLRLGMSTRINAGAVTTVNGRLESTARSIRVDPQVRGAIASVDAATSTLVVLGQTVRVNASTALEALPAGLAGLVPGDVVAVHGDVNAATRQIVATRIEPAAAGVDFLLRGTLDSVDLAAQRMVLQGQTLSLAQLAPGAVPASLAAGQRVRARLAPVVAPVWTVTALRLDELMIESRDNVELEGRISSFLSPQSFSVDGVQVDASAATFPDGTAGLVLGARVEVEGPARNGVIAARKVSLEDEDDDDEGDGGFELEGSIASADAGARTFVLRGVTVVHDANTRFEHGNATGLTAGAKVSVKGSLVDGGTRLLARAIEFH